MLGEDDRRRRSEVDALRLGLDLGMTLIDTAEMYGDGRAEEVVAEAIAGRRDEVFLVDKVLPSNASREGVIAACEASLRRLRTDRIDLYLLHWRGRHPFEETIEAFETLIRASMIRRWGVSNLDLDDLRELEATPGGNRFATDQLLYNLTRRGIEFDLSPHLRERGIPIMAYSPVEQGRLLKHPAVRAVAARRGVAAAQIALAWALRSGDVIVIPKAAKAEHVLANRGALDLTLSSEDLAELDAAFPAPTRPRPLEVL